MPFSFNPGAAWGLLIAIVLLLVYFKVRKIKAERGWQRYGEEQIYRPDEWAEKRARDNPRRDSEDSGSEPGIDSDGTGEEDIGFNGGSESLSVEHDSSSESDIIRDKTIKDSGEELDITIPDIEQVDEGED